MTSRAEAFEQWIRTSFVEMNTELEELYFAQSDRSALEQRRGLLASNFEFLLQPNQIIGWKSAVSQFVADDLHRSHGIIR